MNDDFEQKLSRQPLKKIPGEWRAEILTAATRQNPHVAPPASFLSTINSQLSTLFWPHPKAWARLAAIWIFIFTVNFSMRDHSEIVAKKSAPPSPEMVTELKQQQRMFAELIGANDWRVADRQKLFFPKPRSEYSEILAA